MFRPIRPLAPHLTLHVTAHATGKRLCFPDANTRATFRASVGETLREAPMCVHAFALMDNHLHLLLTSPIQGGVADFMRRLLSSHALSINRLCGHQGQLWRDRYHSVLVETEIHALHSCLYIDANPWRAHLVEHPLESTWTSHRELALGGDMGFLVPHPVLLELGTEGTWRSRYSAIMDEYMRRGSRTCGIGRRLPKGDPLAGLELSLWKGR
jgi:putative transposase